MADLVTWLVTWLVDRRIQHPHSCQSSAFIIFVPLFVASFVLFVLSVCFGVLVFAFILFSVFLFITKHVLMAADDLAVTDLTAPALHLFRLESDVTLEVFEVEP
jgi:hypothetical protein